MATDTAAVSEGGNNDSVGTEHPQKAQPTPAPMTTTEATA